MLEKARVRTHIIFTDLEIKAILGYIESSGLL